MTKREQIIEVMARAIAGQKEPGKAWDENAESDPFGHMDFWRAGYRRLAKYTLTALESTMSDELKAAWDKEILAMDNHHKEVGKLAIAALDAKAEEDELCEMMEGVRDRLETTTQTTLEDVLDGTYHPLKPTESLQQQWNNLMDKGDEPQPTENKAQVDDLLKPAHDVNTSRERVQKTADREHDLLKPTEERVREYIERLLEVDAKRCIAEVYARSNDTDDGWTATPINETLLAENKALRRIVAHPQVIVEHGKIIGHTYNPETHVAVEINQYNLLREKAEYPQFNPKTHVAVDREQTLAAINEIENRLDQARRAFHNSESWYDERTPTGQTYEGRINAAFDEARAMLTAASQEGEG